VSGPLPDPPAMKRVAVLKRLTKPGGGVYYATPRGQHGGNRLLLVQDERGAEDEWVLLQCRDLEPERRR
jgi:hypothetical protein